MIVRVYDTHVRTTANDYYHFDVLVADATEDRVKEFAEYYLQSIGVTQADIHQQRCEFCHVETAYTEITAAIDADGYYIVPMEGCLDR